jgi:hypothetical protein
MSGPARSTCLGPESVTTRAFRRLGLCKTFPQAEVGNRIVNVVGAPMLNLPPVRKRFDKMIKKQMVQPHVKAVTKHWSMPASAQPEST